MQTPTSPNSTSPNSRASSRATNGRATHAANGRAAHPAGGRHTVQPPSAAARAWRPERLRAALAAVCTAALLTGCAQGGSPAGTGPSQDPDATASAAGPEVHTFTPDRKVTPLVSNGTERFGAMDDTTSEFVAYDATGKELWAVKPVLDHTPVVFADRTRVYVQSDEDQMIRALDWTSGKTIWETEPPSDPCAARGKMQLHSAGRPGPKGEITGLLARAVEDASSCDFSVLGPSGYGQALDPATGKPVGDPMRFKPDDIVAGSAFTGDGAGYLQYLSDGQGMELFRYDLRRGELDGVGLTSALADSDIMYGDEVEITETLPDHFELHPKNATEDDPSMGVFGFTITVDSWKDNKVTPGGVIGGGDADITTVTSPSHARYGVGVSGVANRQQQDFSLLDDGTGAPVRKVKPLQLPLPDDEFYERRNAAEHPRGLEDNVLPRTSDRAPIAVLPGPKRSVAAYDAISGTKLWDFTPDDGSFPIVVQSAPALGLIGVAGLSGDADTEGTSGAAGSQDGGSQKGSAGKEKLFILDGASGRVVDEMDGQSVGTGSFFATANGQTITVRGVTGIR